MIRAIFKTTVLLWRIKAPKGPQMSHMAKLRSEHHQSFLSIATTFGVRLLSLAQALFFQQKGGPQRPPVPERDYFCAGKAIYACFLPLGKGCAHFPLAFTKRPGATPLLGRRLRAGRTFASPFWNPLEHWLLWRLRVRFWAATCKCWMTRRRSGSVA